ncbi:MAG: M23 family metallopeptidase [Bacteroidota bacterium]|uniref:peptidoglycan DD-metalloendopeptidase family protein n=2 Tax=Nonlabens TaxID=363408 RepID=UPI000761BC29|nr:M23 family metallopeptidase [Bacteroidota bacterium]
MMQRLFISTFFILCMFHFGESQTNKKILEGYFINPLDIDMKLSGTFGELRSNHFHSGLDIKTNQRTGAKVYAVANGYVSRIKIERYGYGKALYVTHPNGYTSVYAHLEKFAPRIEEYVKKRQYEKESFEIQLFPTDLELRVDQGDIIAYSGNSGGSGGPHLHFEIRDSAAKPINPMLMDIEIPDTKAPIVKQVMAYPLDENSTINGRNQPELIRLIPLKNGDFKTENFKAYGQIGIGVNTNDRQNGAANQNGVYRIKSYLNGTKNFQITFDTYAFNETRYLNRLIDYNHFKKTKSRITKLFIPEGSPLSLYEDHIDYGVLSCYDAGVTNQLKVEIMDFKDNTTNIHLKITTDQPPGERMIPDNSHLSYVNHRESFTYNDGAFNVSIPKGALYQNSLLDIKVNSDTIKIHQDEIPLHKNIYINYNLKSKKEENLKQYYIGRVTDWGSVYYTSSKIKNGVLTGSTRYFGTYAVSKDYTPPTITPVSFKNKQWISNHKTLKIKIDDAQTGIKGYRATVNGEFILMEYDYKTKLLVHDFEDGVVKDGENNLKVIVTDNVGNSTTFDAVFYRKN